MEERRPRWPGALESGALGPTSDAFVSRYPMKTDDEVIVSRGGLTTRLEAGRQATGMANTVMLFDNKDYNNTEKPRSGLCKKRYDFRDLKLFLGHGLPPLRPFLPLATDELTLQHWKWGLKIIALPLAALRVLCLMFIIKVASH